ncbi:MAG: hypothetical protein MUF21_10605 [Gemmatimonadaceae bacterium]|jgi:hypothetical protein|nr:hypothetical protein [Gemmatimonadaceae bacterium]
MSEEVLAVIGLFIVMPVTCFGYLAFRLWLQKREAIVPTPLTHALAERFDGLERQMETLAVEVERLAEGQRFVSRVLTERPVSPPLPTTVDSQDRTPPALPPAGSVQHDPRAERATAAAPAAGSLEGR